MRLLEDSENEIRQYYRTKKRAQNLVRKIMFSFKSLALQQVLTHEKKFFYTDWDFFLRKFTKDLKVISSGNKIQLLI